MTLCALASSDVVGDTGVPAGHGGDNNHRTEVPQVRQREGGQLAVLQRPLCHLK